jgi:hypothetical protein
VVDVDPLGLNAESCEPVALGGEVLLVGDELAALQRGPERLNDFRNHAIAKHH